VLNQCQSCTLGKSFEWLDRMLEQTNYIGLGGVTKNNIAKIRMWFDEVFPYLERQNITGLKVHGFGVTSPSILKSYPWYSVDSSTAVMMAGKAGKCLMPKLGEGVYDYTRPWRLDFRRGVHPYLVHSVDDYLRTIGFGYGDIFDYRGRLQINVLFFRKLIDQIGDNRANQLETGGVLSL